MILQILHSNEWNGMVSQNGTIFIKSLSFSPIYSSLLVSSTLSNSEKGFQLHKEAPVFYVYFFIFTTAKNVYVFSPYL